METTRKKTFRNYTTENIRSRCNDLICVYILAVLVSEEFLQYPNIKYTSTVIYYTLFYFPSPQIFLFLAKHCHDTLEMG